MKCSVEVGDVFSVKVECVVVGFFEDERKSLDGLDKSLSGKIGRLFQRREFSGELGQSRLVCSEGLLPAENVLLVGLGKRKDCSFERLRRASACSVRVLRGLGVKNVATVIHQHLVGSAQAVVEGALLANYQFVKYKTQNVDKLRFVESFVLLVSSNKKDVEFGVREGVVLAQAQCWVRDVVNAPACDVTPVVLAKMAKGLSSSVKVSVFDRKKLGELGMGGVLAVSAGSVQEPQFVVAEYKNSVQAPVVLVGKGVTFDSGGLSLKPAKYMEDMKSDMAGAAVVLSVVKAVAELKLPVHVIAIAPLVENMPSGMAYRPGDVVQSMSKKTIEVLNTDAEGRVILADALFFAESKKPQAIIDVATLTGACVVALGKVAAGMVGTSQVVIDRLKNAGDVVGERLWQLPLYDEYSDMIKSDVADVKNIGSSDGEAGALTAAAFLKVFVDKTPWVHLDIAGPAWSTEDKLYTPKGGTGFGVRLLVELLRGWKQL